MGEEGGRDCVTRVPRWMRNKRVSRSHKKIDMCCGGIFFGPGLKGCAFKPKSFTFTWFSSLGLVALFLL